MRRLDRQVRQSYQQRIVKQEGYLPYINILQLFLLLIKQTEHSIKPVEYIRLFLCGGGGRWILQVVTILILL